MEQHLVVEDSSNVENSRSYYMREVILEYLTNYLRLDGDWEIYSRGGFHTARRPGSEGEIASGDEGMIYIFPRPDDDETVIEKPLSEAILFFVTAVFSVPLSAVNFTSPFDGEKLYVRANFSRRKTSGEEFSPASYFGEVYPFRAKSINPEEEIEDFFLYEEELRRIFDSVSKKGSRENEQPSSAEKRKDRYNDVIPWEDTRASPNDGRYVNANLVLGKSAFDSVYAAQCPILAETSQKDETITDYLRLLLDKQIRTVIIAGEFAPGRLENYLPTESERKVVYGDYILVYVDGSLDSEVRWTRVLLMTDGLSSYLNFLQLHAWRDMEAPSSTLLSRVLLDYAGLRRKDVEDEKNPLDPDYPSLLVHCSAGIGRTGTVIAFIQGAFALLRGASLTARFVNDLLYHIRNQRMSSVQKSDQFLVLVRSLIEWRSEISRNRNLHLLEELFV